MCLENTQHQIACERIEWKYVPKTSYTKLIVRGQIENVSWKHATPNTREGSNENEGRGQLIVCLEIMTRIITKEMKRKVIMTGSQTYATHSHAQNISKVTWKQTQVLSVWLIVLCSRDIRVNYERKELLLMTTVQV